jgi:hypothetical protein
MSPWFEVLLNLVGFAGFIGIATYRRQPKKDDAAPH